MKEIAEKGKTEDIVILDPDEIEKIGLDNIEKMDTK
jgi:hypothetical protein